MKTVQEVCVTCKFGGQGAISEDSNGGTHYLYSLQYL